MVKVCKKVKCERSNGCGFGCGFAKGQVNNGGTIMNSSNILRPLYYILYMPFTHATTFIYNHETVGSLGHCPAQTQRTGRVWPKGRRH